MASSSTPKKPFLSVVIPVYNSQLEIDRLLDTIEKSRYKNFEVIIADDGSRQKIKPGPPRINHSKIPIRTVRLDQNLGPAVARNRGSRVAKGYVLVFLDSDVEIYPDTLYNIAKRFSQDKELEALTGVWDKEQRTNKFFPQFKALRDWSYWINERQTNGYYYLFSTRIAAIKRKLFQRLGGFDESYTKPLVEDMELTYRIAQRHAIVFDPDIRVHHEFEDFLPIAKKYFWRSFYWSELYGKRHRFDSVTATLQESLAAITGATSLIALLVGTLLFFLLPIPAIRLITATLALWLLFLHFILIRKFILFALREKGLSFAIKSFFVGLALYVFIVAGAVYYRLAKRNSL